MDTWTLFRFFTFSTFGLGGEEGGNLSSLTFLGATLHRVMQIGCGWFLLSCFLKLYRAVWFLFTIYQQVILGGVRYPPENGEGGS